MGAGTFSPRGTATRQRLIDAAGLELKESDGRLELAALARRLDGSQGVLYRYFGSKDGLVAAVVHDFYDDYDAAVFLPAADMAGDWQARERSRIAREVAFLYEHPLAEVVVARRLQEPAAAQADAQRVAAQIEVAARNVARGQREGAVAGDVEAGLAAAAFIGAFRELVGEALRRPTLPPQATVVRMMLTIAEAIVPPPAPASRRRRT